MSFGSQIGGIAARAMGAKQAAIESERQRRQEDEARQRQAERDALQMAILRQDADERAATGPLRRRLLEAQAQDEIAQAEGTGRYAPKPVKPEPAREPKYERVEGPDGAVSFYDPVSGEIKRPGLRARVPGNRGVPAPPVPERRSWVATRAIKLLAEREGYGRRYGSMGEAKAAAEDEYETLYGEPKAAPPPAAPAAPAPATAMKANARAMGVTPDEDADPDWDALEKSYLASKRRP